MQETAATLHQNQLLRVLPEKEQISLSARLESVELFSGQILRPAGAASEFAYFPLDSIVSVVSKVSGGKSKSDSIELAMVGCEGATAVQGVFGFDPKIYEEVVQIPGAALRIKLDELKEHLAAPDTAFLLPDLLTKYLTAFCAQVAQAATCNNLHKIEQRLRTWLMMMFNRAKFDEMNLTQDQIALALGCRRPSLAETCGTLQKQNIILYSRGRVRLLDRRRLAESACECYDIMESQYDKVFALPATDSSSTFEAARFKFDSPLEGAKQFTEKNLDSLNDHLHLTQSAVERIRRSCAATEAHCRQQLEFINGQRTELNLPNYAD